MRHIFNKICFFIFFILTSFLIAISVFLIVLILKIIICASTNTCEIRYKDKIIVECPECPECPKLLNN